MFIRFSLRSTHPHKHKVPNKILFDTRFKLMQQTFFILSSVLVYFIKY